MRSQDLRLREFNACTDRNTSQHQAAQQAVRCHGRSDAGRDDVDDVVPVDGGLSLLVAAGIGYGVKKIKAAKKTK